MTADDHVREILSFPESERLAAYTARAIREWEAEQVSPRVLMCACDDLMACEHPYPAIYRMPRPEFRA